MTLTGLELIYLLAFVAGAVGSAYWRWGAALGKVRDDLAAQKLHVAENYVSKAGHREATMQIMDAISAVKLSIDGTNQRHDRVLESKPPTRRS
jgi:hypothetical protein